MSAAAVADCQAGHVVVGKRAERQRLPAGASEGKSALVIKGGDFASAVLPLLQERHDQHVQVRSSGCVSLLHVQDGCATG